MMLYFKSRLYEKFFPKKNTREKRLIKQNSFGNFIDRKKGCDAFCG